MFVVRSSPFFFRPFLENFICDYGQYIHKGDKI